MSAVQLAVAAGCSVATTCGSQSVDRLLAAGADQAVDYVAEVVMNLLFIIFPVNCSDISIRQTLLLKFFVLKLNFLKGKTTIHNILIGL